MNESFEAMLAIGGKRNTLGKVNEVLDIVLTNQSRLEELYRCLFSEDAWIRMRAADAFEKIGRAHPDWLVVYIDKLQADLSSSRQPSIQWHLAQIYKQTELSTVQARRAIMWLEKLLSTVDVDWIVAANAMETLAHFTRRRRVNVSRLLASVSVQVNHKSNAVVKRSKKIIDEFS